MKHTLLLAAIVLLSLAGCTRGIQTGTTSHAGSVPLNEGSDIGYSYSYSMEYLTGGLPQDVMDAINGGIVRSFILFGQEDAGTDVKAACRQWEESGIAGYKSDAEQMLDDFDEESSFMLNWESGIDGRFLPPDAKRNLLTYNCSANDYMGGAHGMYAENYLVFDTLTGAVVKEEDLFQGDWEEVLGKMLKEKLIGDFPEYSDGEDLEFNDVFFGPPYPNGNFSVGKDGITWYYNPYDIAPYALGVIDVTLGWKELEPLLKK